MNVGIFFLVSLAAILATFAIGGLLVAGLLKLTTLVADKYGGMYGAAVYFMAGSAAIAGLVTVIYAVTT